MIYSVPKKLIDIVQRHLLKNYLPPRALRHKRDSSFNEKDLLFFARGAGLLSTAFTKGRERLPNNYLNLKEYRSGYILYFTVTNYLKALFCLSEAYDNKAPSGPIDILDIGTGPGTALIAAQDFFKGRKTKLVGVDRNREILKDARSLIDAYFGGGLDLKTITGYATSKSVGRILGRSRFDVIFLSNVIGEIKNMEKRAKLIETLKSNHLKNNGHAIVIEPALQKTTRELMELRDLLVEDDENNPIVSPCLHGEPCPMLKANRRDWCHMYLEWDRPKIIEGVDRLIGNRKDYLKFSYLVITGNKQRAINNGYRIVSSPLISKGRTEILICGGGLLRRLTQQDKHIVRKSLNLRDLKRGDLVRYSGPDKFNSPDLIKVS